ncbi:hypothetical protein, partial [Bradyrhizobium sp. Arg816]|uniref:hypothetical protein n=1 Tax=Bradyrhizobium sp. Arg816 TaxID=2998491 RepID=UPI00249E5F3D
MTVFAAFLDDKVERYIKLRRSAPSSTEARHERTPPAGAAPGVVLSSPVDQAAQRDLRDLSQL